MPKLDLSSITVKESCAYPSPYDKACKGRSKQALGDAAGLTQFGVNLTRLKPGAASALRHWHKNEDEFVFVVEGEVTLEEDNGEAILVAGEAAGFKAGIETGHRLINKSDQDCVFLEIGTRASDEISTYTDPEVDLQAVKKEGGPWQMLRRNGAKYYD